MVTSHESIARRLAVLHEQRGKLLAQGKRVPSTMDADILRLEQNYAETPLQAAVQPMTPASRLFYAAAAVLAILTIATLFV